MSYPSHDQPEADGPDTEVERVRQQASHSRVSTPADSSALPAPTREIFEQWKQLIEGMDGVLWLEDLVARQTLYLSPNAETVFGKGSHSLLQTPDGLWTLIHPADRERVVQSFRRHVAQGTYDEEFRVTRDDGITIVVRDRAFPVRNADGQAFRIVRYSEDVTERKSSQANACRRFEEIRQASQRNFASELIASIAHQTNQPLHAISNSAGACKNLISRYGEDLLQDAVQWTEEIDLQVRRADAFISQLRQSAPRLPLQCSEVEVNQLVMDTLDFLADEAQNRQILVQHSASPQLSVVADRVQIQQVLLQLLGNAFDAVESVPSDRRRVSVTVNHRETCLQVQIQDAGPGLGCLGFDQLSKPFFTTKPNALGLGLPICRAIVKAHGGEIWSANNEPHGATFVFEIPATQ